MGYKNLYIITLYLVIVSVDKVKCQDSLIFLEKPAFLIMANETLCRVDYNDITNNSNTQLSCLYSGVGNHIAIDVRQNNTYMVYLDSTGDLILIEQTLGRNSDPVTLADHFSGVSAMCFDWMGGNILWADHILNFIGIYNLHTNSSNALITLTSRTPWAVALDIPTGRIFWADDWPSISYSSIGSSRQEYFITTDISDPRNIAIDSTEQRLYWTDLGKISSVDITTYIVTNRKTVVDVGEEYVYGLAISKDYLFWTGTNGVHVAKKADGERIKDFPFSGDIFDVVFNGLYSQPLVPNGCDINNGGCSHICAPASESKRICLCKLGYNLDFDGKTCMTRTVSEDFLIFADGAHKSLYQVNLKNKDTYAIDLPITLEFPHAVEYDENNTMVYFTDIETKRLYKFRIDNPNSVEIIHQFPSSSLLHGLAYDSTTQKLYITDTLDAFIYRIDTDDVNIEPEHLLRNIGSPRDIALELNSRKMYWTDWSEDPPYARIRMADMLDGGNMETIISENIENPTGLTIDSRENKMYWVDRFHLDTIESADLSGRYRTTLTSGIEGNVFGIAHDQRYLYVTESFYGFIHKVDKISGAVTSEAFGVYGEPRGLAVHSSELPITTEFVPYYDRNDVTSDNTALYAGIGVAVAAVVIVCIIVAVVCVYKRKRRRIPSVPPAANVAAPYQQPHVGFAQQVQMTPTTAQPQPPIPGNPQTMGNLNGHHPYYPQQPAYNPPPPSHKPPPPAYIPPATAPPDPRYVDYPKKIAPVEPTTHENAYTILNPTKFSSPVTSDTPPIHDGSGNTESIIFDFNGLRPADK